MVTSGEMTHSDGLSEQGQSDAMGGGVKLPGM